MRVRWLGWAGAEIEADGAGVVIDPLAEPGATFAALGEGARETQLPIVVAPDARSGAVAGLISHLHRDHADAGALADALARDASVYEPAWPGGGGCREPRPGAGQFGARAEGSETGDGRGVGAGGGRPVRAHRTTGR